MVKLFKNALRRVIGEACCKSSLIKLHTFVYNAVRIVNDHLLTSVSIHLNDLLPIFPSSFLSQQLALYIPISTFHDQADLR